VCDSLLKWVNMPRGGGIFRRKGRRRRRWEDVEEAEVQPAPPKITYNLRLIEMSNLQIFMDNCQVPFTNFIMMDLEEKDLTKTIGETVVRYFVSPAISFISS